MQQPPIRCNHVPAACVCARLLSPIVLPSTQSVQTPAHCNRLLTMLARIYTAITAEKMAMDTYPAISVNRTSNCTVVSCLFEHRVQKGLR
jgi:hypothetical protein